MASEPQYSYTNMTTATTTQIRTGPGILHAITINKPVASATITVYDNTASSGTTIGTVTLPATLLDDLNTLFYDVAFTTGLRVVTSQATDITISWKPTSS